jgi:uncharacterized membrane protein YeiB
MKRLEGLDFARSLAILGMMLVNYSLVFEAEAPRWLSQAFSLFEGRAAAVFLILAGIGISFMTRKGRTTGDKIIQHKERVTIAKRSIFLWIIGVTLFTVFEWNADILHYYGAYMLLMLPILYWKPKNIKKLMILVLIISGYLQMKFDYNAGWQPDFMTYTNFWTLSGFFRNLFFNGFHPIFPWFVFMLLGFIVGQMDLMNRQLRKQLLVYGFTTGIITELASIGLITLTGNTELGVYLFGTKPMPPSLFYIFAASGWAICWIILCLSLIDRFPESRWVQVIVKTGQMALTHYIFHSAFVLSFMFILGLITQQNSVFVLLLSLVVYGIMMCFSVLWHFKFQRGPFETLMRLISGTREGKTRVNL